MKSDDSPQRSLADAPPADDAPTRVVVVNHVRIVLFAGAALLAFTFFDAIAKVVLLFLLAFLFAIVLNAPVRRLERRGVRRAVSVAGVVLLLMAALGTAGVVLGPRVTEEANGLVQNAPESLDRLRAQADRLVSDFPLLGRFLDTETLTEEKLAERFALLMPRIGRYTVSFFGGIAAGVVVLVTALYTVASPRPLVRGLLTAVPPGYRSRAARALTRIVAQLEAWALATLVLMGIIFLVSWIGLSILAVPNSLLYGLLAGFGEAIPTIGPIVSAVPPMFAALSESPSKALWVAALFFVIQQVENHLLVPWVMSKNLNLHPVSILFFVIALGALLGITGALLAVPTAIITKVLFEEFYARKRPADPDDLDDEAEQVIQAGDTEPPAPPAPRHEPEPAPEG
ncbi:MAG TPA: AI-2E family transporter [Armatimonadaceae bacterium]|nr:AI-2E family transporter [Armatimonadaceae bacterium]